MNDTLRVARADDWPALHRVRMAVRENVLSNPASVTEADYIEHIEQFGRGWLIEVNSEHGGEAGGEVAGFAIGNARSGNIWALFVDPAHEGRGYGRRLHDTMVAWLFEQGLDRLWLGTEPGTRAEAFYTRAGWLACGLDRRGEMRFERRR